MNSALKRYLDFQFSGFGLALLAPLLLVIAVLVKLDSPGPVIYKATRVGRDGRPFKLYKFRSMVANADKLGPGVTGAADPRITRMGRVLRRTKLDELPQLWNVFKGDMSLVGPRPEDQRYVALYTPEQREVLRVRPGITSLASLRFRHEERLLNGSNWEQHYIEDVMPAKLQIDLEYVRRQTLLQDARIVLWTLRALFD